MQKQTSSADDVLWTVRKLARPDDHGAKSVDVSLVSSVTGLSNTAIVDLVSKLTTFGASVKLNEDEQTILVL